LQKLVSCVSVAAFLFAGAPRFVPLSTLPDPERATTASCCCCNRGGASEEAVAAPCCCCPEKRAESTTATGQATAAQDGRGPYCPCGPSCPTRCCQVFQVQSPCCTVTGVSSPCAAPGLEHLAAEASLFCPPGPCDDVMHPPRA